YCARRSVDLIGDYEAINTWPSAENISGATDAGPWLERDWHRAVNSQTQTASKFFPSPPLLLLNSRAGLPTTSGNVFRLRTYIRNRERNIETARGVEHGAVNACDEHRTWACTIGAGGKGNAHGGGKTQAAVSHLTSRYHV